MHPITILVVTLLLLGGQARAQPASSPVSRQRGITLTGSPNQPVHEVHGARGVALMFLFDGPLQREFLQVDPSRLRIVDAGQRSLILEPLVDLAPGERTEVRVAFAEGAPRHATFALVHHPAEVDTWINVTRHVEDPDAACQARLEARCDAHSPTAIRRSGLLGSEGVSVGYTLIDTTPSNTLQCVGGLSFRAKEWVLLEVRIENMADQAWTPREAVVKNETGETLGVRHVEAEHEAITPGGHGYVWVETEAPAGTSRHELVLELHGVDGRSVRVPSIKLVPLPSTKLVPLPKRAAP